ncbi:TonB-dependent siderophore receptor [Celerinatantimonas diazotrophica]|uniref:TonB-dependent siderophore receptor n=1 Tax=Celerinatantimonas diazotrophica TaxID=412034 RepID=A0A4V2PNC7_9GAMM|nr:TonB-dependent receptor [Celerinatantimonas diazotrophica]TCK46547.1 TonB-dependent siderophore receptor [Celerinatantimonas diazotrophica]CAG9296597.1 Metal-pseudopaline receptor CntO [Celerinatantimonas diazotrophica]
MSPVFRLSVVAVACLGAISCAYAADNRVKLNTLNVSANSTQITTKTSAAADEQSVTVNQLTSAEIDDSQPRELSDAISILPGIQASGTNSYSYTSRGFALSRDSVKIDGMNAWALKDNQIPMIAVDHVDVLKGVGSMLYGSQPVGGTLNIVTKKPQAQSYHKIEIAGGSYLSSQTNRWIGARRIAFDSTGTVNDHQDFLYRVIGDYKGDSGFADYQNTHGYYLTPMFTWLVDDKQSLMAQFELTRYTYNYASALVAPDSDINKVAAISTNYYGPQNQASDQGVSATLTYQRDLVAGWHNTTRWRSVWHRDARTNFDVGRVTDSEVLRHYRNQLNYQLNHQLDSYFTGQLQTGSIKHNLTFGFGWAHTRNNFNRLNLGKNDPSLTVAVYSPSFSYIDTASISNSSGRDLFYTYDTYSVYGQDILALTQRLSFTFGSRLDWQHRTTSVKTTSSSKDDSTHKNYWTPSAGISYQFNPTVRWHFGYAQSYETSSLLKTDVNGNPFEPTRGEQYETGLHFTPNSNWSADVNLFHIVKKNVIVKNNSGDDAALGRVRSQGAEVSLNIIASNHLSLYSSYTYLDTKVLQGAQNSNSEKGNQFINAPHHRIALTGSYEVNDRWQMGATARAQTHSYGSTDNELRLPGYATFDLNSSFKLNANMTLDVSLKNIFDKTYYSAAKNANAIYAGEPRYLQAKLSYEF